MNIEFIHYSVRIYGEPKLEKPKELKGISQLFSVDYIPKKCKSQIFILGNDVWIKHNDYFSKSMTYPIEDIGTPLSYRAKKYLGKDMSEKFIYPDTWGDIVLRNNAWLLVKNLYKVIHSGIFVLDIKDELLRQQERLCKFEKYELSTGYMGRMWEQIINIIKRDYKL